ncbi:sulfurtransferase [Bauldia sp.]|uniref:sulfurtransferase n=1 Tax=Bauldia sp. TaxID=2575872 RepID=UPI003BAA695B
MDTLVSVDWLADHLNDPDLVVLDCSVHVEQTESGMRTLSGREDYDGGHIPGAGFADLKGDLCDSESPIGFAVPTPEAFCAAMSKLGVGDESRVVLYDSSSSVWAARVWWMLRWVGFDRAAILDGGLNAWKAAGHSLSTEPATYPARTLTPNPRPQLIADRDEVLAAIDDADVSIIDTLPAGSYRGEMKMYARPGHILSAVNVCGMDMLDETGRHKPMADLDAMHTGDRDARAITYCGGGILASLNAFVMTRLGFKDVAVYTASLQEWAADPDNPMTSEPS